ncbi:DNA mismatch repair protein MutS [Desulfogranum mediterraneum]|uniref:DNA mismatch repair protein MutS n=1 Tax=Desulfogranum mediterraneum TaxID=160661 RepID=UPI00041DA9AB|nr:DNA mismatch repair protein MutS [Desulfogranum mediterraneum]
MKITPMLRQYLEIKEQHQDAILFYRMGDFYEMFFADAVAASKILGITLTSRSSKEAENKIPMCGIPFHAAANYLGKLVKAGHRVAICEQVEDPKQTKGIVRREVVRIVSPGVTTDEQILDAKTNCFVCALVFPRKSKGSSPVGLSFLDASTGNFLVSEVPVRGDDHTALLDMISRINPAEILLSEEHYRQQQPLVADLKGLQEQLCFTLRPEEQFQQASARITLLEHFQTVNLDGFGCAALSSGIRAAGGLLAYIEETQKAALGHVRKLTPINQEGHLVIDESSRRNLELTETLIGGRREGSLLSVLDHTITPMGARLLRQRLLFPLQEQQRIEQRLDGVEELVNDPGGREQLRRLLEEVHDLERLCSRLVLGQGNARDMWAMKVSLAQLPAIRQALEQWRCPLLRAIHSQLDELTDLHQLIGEAIREDAPITLREGRLIREGFHQELDRLIHLLRNDRQLILNLEAKERERTKIAKLKVGYNKVFGYFFEVSRAQSAQIPEDFIRKQTLVNAERFITPELKELEHSIATAQDKRLELEYALFSEIRERIAAQSSRILDTAQQIARIDVLACLAELACQYRYCKPRLNSRAEIRISEGRHPVIERTMESGRFVPNDVRLDQDSCQLMIITGPNMAGKSTVLRQTALIVLLTHIGSFVPATEADICTVDRIFTRVGAMDDLRRGQSTFMVEMNETANILNNATSHSLVILDEIGRGTSTYDGLAIAWAVAEELVTKDQTGIKTMFATHYHELTELAASQERVLNASIAVREWNETIIFLHKLIPEATNRSYGIQVAALAGVPEHVTRRAYEILAQVEQGDFHHHPSIAREKRGANPGPEQPCQLSLFPTGKHPVIGLLEATDPDELTPRQAQEILYEAQRLLRAGDS